MFHFMTRRFDRNGAAKGHMHSLGGMTHVDYNRPQAYSYEAWFRLILDMSSAIRHWSRRYRRMLFNIVGRNQDDHVKNIAFLMRRPVRVVGLAPAYDLTFAAGSNYTRRPPDDSGGLSDNFTGAEARRNRAQVRHPHPVHDPRSKPSRYSASGRTLPSSLASQPPTSSASRRRTASVFSRNQATPAPWACWSAW